MAAATFYVRKTGSAANGGSSTGTSPQRTGSDGVTNGTTTFTSATGAFTNADVDKLINIVTKGRYRITAVTNTTTVTLSGSPTAGSSLTWNLGGACLNIGDLLQATAGTIANGDAIWIGAGTYRETITLTNTNSAEVTVNADVDGVKTGDIGMVRWTNFTTNDTTLPTANSLVTTAAKGFLTFTKIFFEAGADPSAATLFDAQTATTSASLKFTDCAFYGSNATKRLFYILSAFAAALNWTFDRCVFYNATNASNGNHILFQFTTGVGSDYDVNVVIKNCLFIGGGADLNAIRVLNSGTAANKGNGVKITNCTFIACSAIQTSTNISTSIASTVNNCVIHTGGVALNAGSSGNITEDYNLIAAATARTNVSTGTHSQTAYSQLMHFGQERIWGALLRTFAEPMAGSPLLGFGNDGNQTTYDLRNNPKPAGGASASAATGALERSNTWAKETGTVRTGTNALSITGPGYQDFDIPVDALSTAISVYMRYDSTYAGTRPQIQVLNGTECGVADQTITFTTGALNAWEQQTVTVVPTSVGIVTVRLISNDTNGGGKAFADDFAVT